MKANSGPAISTICRKIRACRSCPAFNCLDQEKHWSPKLQRYRPRCRHDPCSSDSDPAPGPSGVSHVSHRPLDTEGHSGKRSREEDEMEYGSASKKSRSKSPIRGKTKTWRIAEARRRKRHPDPSSSSSEEKTQKEWRLHGLGYTPAECLIDNASDENEVYEETPTYPPDDVAHDGTLEYLTPEWFRNTSYTSTSATAWQLGLALFAMLFNKKPLVTEHTIASTRGVPIPKSVSEECRDLLRGCLAKNPKKRFSLEQIRNHLWLNTD